MTDRTAVYVGCRLFDGAAEVVEDAALAVAGGEVRAAGPRERVLAAAGPDPELVDLAGACVLPGLVDAHTHLHFPIRGFGDWPTGLVEPPEFTAIKAVRNAGTYLAAGVTTVMDCGTRGNLAVALREAVANGVCQGPRIVASGMVVSPTAGLADDHPEFLHLDHPEGEVADTPEQWRAVIRRQAKQGVDNLKIGVSGSALNPYSDSGACDLGHDEIAMIVAEAHRVGCTVAAHVSPPDGFVDCLRAGVDTVHHGFGIDQRCVDALGTATAYFVPTSYKLRAMVEGGVARGRDPARLDEYRRQWDGHVAALRMAVAAGLADRIAVGSDGGHLPGHGQTAAELAVLLEAGMTARQALAAATGVAAAAVGLAGTVGTLRPGALADFLVVDADPVADPTVLADPSRIRAVYQSGRLVAQRGQLTAPPSGGPDGLAPVFLGRGTRTWRSVRRPPPAPPDGPAAG